MNVLVHFIYSLVTRKIYLSIRQGHIKEKLMGVQIIPTKMLIFCQLMNRQKNMRSISNKIGMNEISDSAN